MNKIPTEKVKNHHSDTELDEVLTRLYATGGFNLDGTSIAHKRVEPLELGEAKQKLLKLIDKEVTRSRIDELKALVPPEQFKDYVKLTGHEACTICGFNSEVFRRHLESRIKAIQEEGTDNE